MAEPGPLVDPRKPGALLVVVPARGGSTRVPRKNIAPLAGVPLLHWTLATVRNSGLLDATIVSTDDTDIAMAARQMGAAVVDRPPELAHATASTEAALLHTLDRVARTGRHPAWIMTLPPTSPFRTIATIAAVLDCAVGWGATADCIMTVTETRDDLWQRVDDASLRRLFPDAPRRQQDRSPLFVENSAVYLTRTAVLRQTGSVLGTHIVGVPIGRIEAFDINEPDDLALAEAVVAAGLAPCPAIACSA